MSDQSLASGDLAGVATDLRAAFRRYDETVAHALLDSAFATHPVEDVIELLVFPFLRQLGEAWERGEISVAQEHWASGLVRGRLMALAPTVAARRGEATHGVVVLACPTHERHDIGLLALDLVLRGRGWECVFLGADTPVEAATQLSGERRARALVLCGSEPHMYDAQLDAAGADLRGLPATTTLLLAGRAATPELAERHGAVLLPLSTVLAADHVDACLREPVR